MSLGFDWAEDDGDVQGDRARVLPESDWFTKVHAGLYGGRFKSPFPVTLRGKTGFNPVFFSVRSAGSCPKVNMRYKALHICQVNMCHGELRTCRTLCKSLRSSPCFGYLNKVCELSSLENGLWKHAGHLIIVYVSNVYKLMSSISSALRKG